MLLYDSSTWKSSAHFRNEQTKPTHLPPGTVCTYDTVIVIPTNFSLAFLSVVLATWNTKGSCLSKGTASRAADTRQETRCSSQSRDLGVSGNNCSLVQKRTAGSPRHNHSLGNPRVWCHSDCDPAHGTNWSSFQNMDSGDSCIIQ